MLGHPQGSQALVGAPGHKRYCRSEGEQGHLQGLETQAGKIPACPLRITYPTQSSECSECYMENSQKWLFISE